MLHAQKRIAKTAVRFAGNRWPQTTADLAFRIFTRTGQPHGKKRAGVMPDGLTPLLLQTASGVVATWDMPAARPAGRKALLVHGWNSRSGHMMALARSLNDAGTDVVLLDLPGHGASFGRHFHLGRGIDAVDAAWRHHGPFDHYVAHSLGGAVALNAALGSSMTLPARRPKSLVMIASPDSMPAIFRWFGRHVGLPGTAQALMERKVLSIVGRSLDLLVASDQLKDDCLPVLIVHDRDDTDVPYADAVRMSRSGPHVRLHSTSGLGHRRVLKDAGVHAAVLEFMHGMPAKQINGARPRVLECA